MEKKVRKAVRTFLIENNKVVAIKYKRDEDKNYYDIPGGKIEDNETSVQAAIREFKEETGMDIFNPKYKGNVIIEYPKRIFDFDIYSVNEYNGVPLNFEENDSLWIDIEKLINYDKVFPSIEILKGLISNEKEIIMKINCDENHIITHIEKAENNEKRKIVTLCGSVRFWDKMQELSEKLEIENEYAVIGLIPHVMDRDFTKQEKELIGELHKAKIDISDAIFVVNVNGYIGESTKSEIEYAKQKGKEIMYLENI